jgi:hypothetical protein
MLIIDFDLVFKFSRKYKKRKRYQFYHSNLGPKSIIKYNYPFHIPETLVHLDISIHKYQIRDENTEKFGNVSLITLKGQNKISYKSFINFQNLVFLDISGCNQSKITDKAFRYLTNLKKLIMSWCNQPEITDEAFKNLRKLEYLNISRCNQETLTHEIFNYMPKLKILKMHHCNQNTMTQRLFLYIKNIEKLNIAFCDQLIINSSVIELLEKLKKINVIGVHNSKKNPVDFEELKKKIKVINMWN